MDDYKMYVYLSSDEVFLNQSNEINILYVCLELGKDIHFNNDNIDEKDDDDDDYCYYYQENKVRFKTKRFR